MSDVKTKELEALVSYSFKNKKLLKEALTHRSYLNERSRWNVSHNERLEFLGDAVLELVVTEELYNRFPDYEEGILTSYRAALVNYQMLARVAGEISLGDFIYLSKGEARDTGRAREVILANGMEALIGAIYLDGGYKPIQQFINSFVLSHIDEVITQKLYKDAKSSLQEKAQSDFKVTPEYKTLSEEGPDHKKTFTIGVFLEHKKVAEGKGPSKQEGEIEAAKNALTKLFTEKE